MEVVGVNEPQWILEKADSGILFWKRRSDEQRRVKFRYEVDVKEFHRAAYELDDQHWPEIPGKDFLISVSCAVCISLTVVILPWYLMLGKI